MTEALQRAAKAYSVSGTIIQWIFDTDGATASKLARQLGISRQFMTQVMAGDRELPDDRIALLPDGLRQTVAEIRARRYEGIAAALRHAAGITHGDVKHSALHDPAPVNSEMGRPV